MVDRAEAEEVASAFAGEVAKRGWVRVNCPLCGDDHKMSLGLNTSTNGYHCFKCGVHGWLPPDLRDFERDPFDESEAEDAVEPAGVPLPDGFHPIFQEPGWSASVFDPARGYMRQRGISDEVCAAVGIGAIAGGWLSGRVIVPLRRAGEVRGWVGRDYTGAAKLPYQYPKGMSRERMLFNIDTLYDEMETPAMIVEGCFDALPYWPDAAACLGKPIGSHIDVFKEAKRPLCIVLDGDAWEEGWILAMRLKHLGVSASSVRLPPGEDPGSVDSAWLLGKVAESAQDNE